MQIVLVPHSVDASSARLWICVAEAASTPGDIPITLSNGSQSIARFANWRLVTAGNVLSNEDSRVFTQVVEFSNLPARSTLIATANDARARFSTLPAAVPRVGDRPLSVLLGSCYFGDHDRGLSTLVQSLLNEVQPDIKFLCGDQVYLDFPSFIFGVPFSARGQAMLFLGKYLRNWTQLSRYRSLLQEGGTYFTADDHEFWNNFPNAATIISATWSDDGRAQYRGVAAPLFKDFQSDDPAGPTICRRLKVGNLSFMVADTRLDRERGDVRFMQDQDLNKVVEWAETLAGPGVLVVGQPVFEQPQTGLFGGFKRRFGDRNLADYDRYRTLVNALLAAQHSVLILTGDVHYPRVAIASRPGQSGREIVEVIASPVALVAGSHAKTKDPPTHFPSAPIANVSLPISTIEDSRDSGDNLVTLEFTETPGRINVQIRYWSIGESQAHGPSISLFLT